MIWPRARRITQVNDLSEAAGLIRRPMRPGRCSRECAGMHIETKRDQAGAAADPVHAPKWWTAPADYRRSSTWMI
jgi:hypothetical protein